jgi:hypothetical protein
MTSYNRKIIVKEVSSLDEVANFLELGQMVEHQVAHQIIELIEDSDDGGHQFGLVLFHQFVEQGEHTFEQQLLLLLVDILQHFLELLKQVQPRLGERVEDTMTEVLQNDLNISLFQQHVDTLLCCFSGFLLVRTESGKDTIADDPEIALNY